MNTLSTYNQFRPAGMAGLFSWLKKAVKAVFNSIKTALPFTSGDIFDVFEDLTNGDGYFGGQNFNSVQHVNHYYLRNIGPRPEPIDIPLSGEEERVLDIWVDFKFIPYFRRKLNELKDANQQGISVDNFIQLFNNTYLIKSFFDWYLDYSLVNENSQFSVNAKRARHELIKSQMSLLEEQLQIYIDSKSIQLNVVEQSVVVNTYEFNRLLSFTAPESVTVNAIQAINLNSNALVAIDETGEVIDDNINTQITSTVSDLVIPPDPSTSKQINLKYPLIAIGIIAYALIRKNKN